MTDKTPAARLAAFIAKFTPAMARDIRACRRRMRALVPRGYELVYDNYNALGIGYGTAAVGSHAILSIVAYPRYIRLFFLQGIDALKDPEGLLEGQGSQVRSIRLASPADLDRAAIRRLIDQALRPHARALAACPAISVHIKGVTTRQISRRPRQGS